MNKDFLTEMYSDPETSNDLEHGSTDVNLTSDYFEKSIKTNKIVTEKTFLAATNSIKLLEKRVALLEQKLQNLNSKYNNAMRALNETRRELDNKISYE